MIFFFAHTYTRNKDKN